MNNKFAKKSLSMLAKKMTEFGEKLSRNWKTHQKESLPFVFMS
jgi:hypothetical protein